MTGAWRAVGAVIALGATAAVGALSARPWTAEPADHAVLRLAWRVRGVRVETCRARTAEELAALPVHMRQDTVCVGRVAPYHLTVEVGPDVLVRDSVHAAGARADRPLFVSRSLPVPPATHQLHVLFERDTAAQAESTADRPARLRLDTTVTLEAGTITLITYDPDLHQLVLRQPGTD